MPLRTADPVLAAAHSDGAYDGATSNICSVHSNPEFLTGCMAIADQDARGRVLIGGDDPAALLALAVIYGQWVPDEKILTINQWSSERSKLTANAFLAQLISSINSTAALCEATGAEVREVARAIGADSCISGKFLQAGSGFGGSCFERDILNLVYLCRHYGLEEVATYWEQVVILNTWQQNRIARPVVNRLFGTVTGKRIGLLGSGFNADTNDTRELQAIRIYKDLLEEGAALQITDPRVIEWKMALDLGQPPGAGECSWHCMPDVEQAAPVSDALLLTEWQQFDPLKWIQLVVVIWQPALFFDERAKADAASALMNVWRVREDRGMPDFAKHNGEECRIKTTTSQLTKNHKSPRPLEIRIAHGHEPHAGMNRQHVNKIISFRHHTSTTVRVPCRIRNHGRNQAKYLVHLSERKQTSQRHLAPPISTHPKNNTR
jgi:UDPglucose 6-dehydrogenase